MFIISCICAGGAAADRAHVSNRTRHALRRDGDAVAHEHATAATARTPNFLRHRCHAAPSVCPYICIHI